MNWGSAQTFFEMGGYGLYVWGSYLITAMVVVAEVFGLRRRLRAAQVRAKRTQALAEGGL